MTINIQSTTKGGVTVWHHEQDGQPGFIFNYGGATQWIPESEATRLAEYIIPAAIVTKED